MWNTVYKFRLFRNSLLGKLSSWEYIEDSQDQKSHP